MPGTTPLYQLPHLVGTDGGKQIASTSLALAQRLEAILRQKGEVPLDSDLATLLTRLDAVEKRAADVAAATADTGWQAVTQIGTGWKADATNPPRIRRVGKRVDLMGYLNYDGGSWANMLTVPVGFRLPSDSRADPAGFVISLNGLGIKLALSGSTHIIAGTLHFGSVNPTVVPIAASWYVA